MVVAPGVAIEEPVGRVLRERGITVRELAAATGLGRSTLSNARVGRYRLGAASVVLLEQLFGIDFCRPQYVLRCGLWLRNGVPDAEQRAALRRARDGRVRQLNRSARGYHLGGARLAEDHSHRVPSAPCGPSNGYLPSVARLALRSHLEAAA